MNVFYNKQGIGDTLLVSLKEIAKEKRKTEVHGNVARLYHEQTKETTGYTIFSASSYGAIHGEGMLAVDAELIALIQKALDENDINETAALPEAPSFVVGYLEEIEKHPDADKLNVCQVNIGNGTTQIVCGASNIEEGQKVPVALPGAYMPTGMKIKKSKLRGVASNGMICSAKELVLPSHLQKEGIYILDEEYVTGEDFLSQYHAKKSEK
ncbi:YtpR family tRNA-binding protein [Sinobaca sp. H24]|uniref:YtpR family tRNA-binding protein n=1 Tax=Sinobaca sp. H24 TaxID=2923376 RepID=UPI002079C000|nr:DUF4479 family protein [Sinobaca sp. H24]